METIRVNMTPCEDIKTIHASQNDGEARQWEFELHNNGDKIDSSSISDQLVFKAYEGGTEEILPTNGSTPTTSPFIGDIKYPQGLLSDQEFLYRESPAEEDGLAKITDIKGNTLVWNQLVGTNVNGLNTTQGTTFSLNSNGSIHVTGTGTGNHFCEWRTYENPNFILIKGHKYLVKFKGLTTGIVAQVSVTAGQTIYLVTKSNYVGDYDEIFTPTQDGITGSLVRFYATNTFSGTTDITMQLFDLTQMGLDITDPSDFTSLFPLPYYAYNQGTLLSFMGNGIKTTGKNLLETATSGSVSGVTFTVNNDGSITVNGTATSNGTYDIYRNTTVLPSWARAGETYVLSLTNIINRFDIFSYDLSGTSKSLASISGLASQTFTIPNDAVGLLVRIFVTRGVAYDVTVYPQIEFGTTPSSYEPYTSSTLSLPISTYFPTGMKQAGTVYDELLPNKATTRIGKVTVDGTNTGIGATALTNVMRITVPIDTAKYNSNQISNNLPFLVSYTSDTEHFYVSDTYIQMFIDKTKCGTTFNSVKQYLSSNPTIIYYELATPTETEITTASLVTENGEVALANENGVLVGKCNSDVSAEAGFIEGKIKLSDEDGDVYSNKIQIHVERSPQ